MTITNDVPIHVRIPKALHSAAQLKAKEDDRTFSYIVRKALQAYLDTDHYPGNSKP
jgi:predicted HicB family RNase H-like nuclease